MKQKPITASKAVRLFGPLETKSETIRTSVLCAPLPGEKWKRVQSVRVLGLRGASANEVAARARKESARYGVPALFEIVGKHIVGGVRNGKIMRWNEAI
jgi:hypothetical protein